MFIPNQTCYLRRKLPGFNQYGEATYGNKETVPFAQVRFDDVVQNTAVRADASATRGIMKEDVATGRLLVPPSVNPTWGDLFIVRGKVFRVKKLEARYNVMGTLDHYQVDYEKAEDNYGDES